MFKTRSRFLHKTGTVLLLILLMSFIKPAAPARKTPINRGTLLLQKRPAEIDSFFSGDSIRLSYVRNICNFLTDPDILYYEGHLLPKRKKAFVRHIKQIYEHIEQDAIDHRKVFNYTEDLFYELALYDASLKQKAIADSKTVSRKDQYNMFRDSRRSRKLFHYEYKITDHEATNVDADNLTGDPDESPFWHNGEGSYFWQTRFDWMASLKKINAKGDMVVLFDKPSLSGSSPKIDVMDLDLDNGWSVKWGDEIHTDAVGSRIFAELGYDVDHPYYYGKDKLTLIFNESDSIKNIAELKSEIKEVYSLDLSPFISSSGIVTIEMAQQQPDLKNYIGKSYARFVECSIEGRPDRVKRLGSFLPGKIGNAGRRELRGALLAHEWIGNWDTREENTLLTLVHMGDYRYRPSAVFSDLGTGFGISKHGFPADFKTGLVNEFEWEIAHEKKGIVYLDGEINSILPCYAQATFYDLCWMANKIARIDSTRLREIVNSGGWSEPVAELYFHKLASRRASILNAFRIQDPHPIAFNKNLSITINGMVVVQNGKLITDYESAMHPESYLKTAGRFRNYGY